MIITHKAIAYNTLEALNETYKPNNPDILRLKAAYGENVSFSRRMRPLTHHPRYVLECYTITDGLSVLETIKELREEERNDGN